MSEIQVRAYTQADLPDMIRIWNEVVEDGIAFPQEEMYTQGTCTSVLDLCSWGLSRAASG